MNPEEQSTEKQAPEKGEDRMELLKASSQQLLPALICPLLIIVVLVGYSQLAGADDTSPSKYSGLTALLVFAIGFLGGYVSVQRRLLTIRDEDLKLIANAWFYTMLAPLTGGILALLLMFIFAGGLLSGPLFPKFVPDPGNNGLRGFVSAVAIHSSPAGYARLIVWSFIAGFSERFVLDALGQFEKKGSTQARGDSDEEPDGQSSPPRTPRAVSGSGRRGRKTKKAG